LSMDIMRSSVLRSKSFTDQRRLFSQRHDSFLNVNQGVIQGV
jgi:hypothetical protein